MLLHLTYCFEKKLQSLLNVGQNVSLKLLEIIPADLLDTLIMYKNLQQLILSGKYIAENYKKLIRR